MPIDPEPPQVPECLSNGTNATFGEQLELGYKKLKSMQTKKRMTLELIDKTNDLISGLEDSLKFLQTDHSDPSKLSTIREKYGLRTQLGPKVALEQHRPYRRFATEQRQPILVGKAPSDNDALTKSARSNDIWVHIVGSSGSHVIIPNPKRIQQDHYHQAIRRAAILAIYYSKKRQDMAGEVYIARKQGIRKQKGLPPGLWLVDNAEVMYVKFNQDELKAILASSQS